MVVLAVPPNEQPPPAERPASTLTQHGKEASRIAAGLSAGGGCSFGGTASTTNGLHLAAAATKANGSYLRVSAPVNAGATPLAAGQYADTLTITVSIVP